MQTWLIKLIKYRRWLIAFAGVALAGFAAWLIFGVFAVHLLFIDDEVNEDVPDFLIATPDASVTSVQPVQPDASAQQPDTDLPTTSLPDTGAQQLDTDLPATNLPDTGAQQLDTSVPDTTTQQSGSANTEVSSVFVDRSHPTSGDVTVLSGADGRRVLRFENFKTDNGPDLDVYLSAAAPDAPASEFDDDFINLGDLKGNIGNQNYEIPLEVDLEHYSTVVIWCVRFGVAFGVADLA